MCVIVWSVGSLTKLPYLMRWEWECLHWGMWNLICGKIPLSHQFVQNTRRTPKTEEGASYRTSHFISGSSEWFIVNTKVTQLQKKHSICDVGPGWDGLGVPRLLLISHYLPMLNGRHSSQSKILEPDSLINPGSNPSSCSVGIHFLINGLLLLFRAITLRSDEEFMEQNCWKMENNVVCIGTDGCKLFHC